MFSRREAVVAMCCLTFRSGRALAAGSVRQLGVLSPTTHAGSEDFRLVVAELHELGFAQHRNLRVEWRYSNDDETQLEPLARELVDAGVHAILTVGTPATRAAIKATRANPIVTAVGDPVGAGLARTEGKPGGNVTGLSWGLPEQAQKVIELQRALVPNMPSTFLIVDGHDGGPLSMIPMYEAAARQTGIGFDAIYAKTRRELDEFLSRRGNRTRVGAVTFTRYQLEPADLARRAIAGKVALFAFRSREWVEAGGVAAHGFFHRHQNRRTASLVAAALRGTPAGELPFEMPDVEWVAVNARTCQALGLVLPPSIRLKADLIVH